MVLMLAFPVPEVILYAERRLVYDFMPVPLGNCQPTGQIDSVTVPVVACLPTVAVAAFQL